MPSHKPIIGPGGKPLIGATGKPLVGLAADPNCCCATAPECTCASEATFGFTQQSAAGGNATLLFAAALSAECETADVSFGWNFDGPSAHLVTIDSEAGNGQWIIATMPAGLCQEVTVTATFRQVETGAICGASSTRWIRPNCPLIPFVSEADCGEPFTPQPTYILVTGVGSASGHCECSSLGVSLLLPRITSGLFTHGLTIPDTFPATVGKTCKSAREVSGSRSRAGVAVLPTLDCQRVWNTITTGRALTPWCSWGRQTQKPPPGTWTSPTQPRL
jgi:hypothetical protein